MAKWNIKPGFMNNSITAGFEYDGVDGNSSWQVTQDETPYVDFVKQERETHSNKHTHMRKFATIPDIVAMELLHNHNLDLHDPAFQSDPSNMVKFKKIIISEYPHLVVST